MNKGPYRHLLRAVVLVTACLLVFFLVRAFLVPKSFGQFGFFRGENLEEQAGIPAVHGGPLSCGECHDGQSEQIAGGPHTAVPCQDCHAPLAQHVTEEGIEPMPITISHTLCARCHQKLEARPKTFPQIDFHEHLVSKNQSLEDETICLSCHLPHNPLPKR